MKAIATPYSLLGALQRLASRVANVETRVSSSGGGSSGSATVLDTASSTPTLTVGTPVTPYTGLYRNPITGFSAIALEGSGAGKTLISVDVNGYIATDCIIGPSTYSEISVRCVAALDIEVDNGTTTTTRKTIIDSWRFNIPSTGGGFDDASLLSFTRTFTFPAAALGASGDVSITPAFTIETYAVDSAGTGVDVAPTIGGSGVTGQINAFLTAL